MNDTPGKPAPVTGTSLDERIANARKQLDAHFVETVRWHFSPETGTPFWLEKVESFDFDPLRKYPIILYVYPGPQTESVTKTFNPRSNSQALAQFGFIVVEVGNRGGNPQRSKWYHNYGYGNLRDYGLADKKAAVEQLARRHSFIDVNKVGIWGHSGGGFMSTAAMLVYPDFFKVAVSESGNHENNELPVLLLGRGGGQIRSGRVLNYLNRPNRKMCSLYLSLLDKAGVRLERFGDSNERLAEI